MSSFHYDQDFYNREWKKIVKKQMESNQLLIKERWKTISTMLRPFIHLNGDDLLLIDLGCGDGTTLELIESSFGIKGAGLDFSSFAVELARKKGFSVFLNSLEEEIPLESNSYDFIICSEVMEHLRYPQRGLKNIYKILKSEGLVLFSLPNLGFIKNRLKLLLGRNPLGFHEYELSFHLHHWTFNGWTKFLNDYGFKVVKNKGAYSKTVKGRSFIPLRPSLFSNNIYCLAKKKIDHK